MRIPRVFIDPENREDGHVQITGAAARHLTRVLRLGPGAELVALDGKGGAFRARIEKETRDGVSAVIEERIPATGEPGVKITLVQGLPKADKMDYVVQKATEIGVSRIIPLASERAVVRTGGERADKKRERWRRIAVSAAEQAFRAIVPEILPVMTLSEVLEAVPAGALLLFPWEEERRTPLQAVLRAQPAVPDVYIFIGPEGGFTEAEAEAARAHGAHCVTLGPRLLRTETAGPVVAALVLYEWGEMG